VLNRTRTNGGSALPEWASPNLSPAFQVHDIISARPCARLCTALPHERVHSGRATECAYPTSTGVTIHLLFKVQSVLRHGRSPPIFPSRNAYAAADQRMTCARPADRRESVCRYDSAPHLWRHSSSLGAGARRQRSRSRAGRPAVDRADDAEGAKQGRSPAPPAAEQIQQIAEDLVADLPLFGL
jgi:hypothetical protein